MALGMFIVGSTVASISLYQKNKAENKISLIDHLDTKQDDRLVLRTNDTKDFLLVKLKRKNDDTNGTSLYGKIKGMFQTVKQRTVDPIGMRRQQMVEFGEEMSEAEKEMNRLFMIASANLGIAVISLFYTPLIVVLVLIEIYCCIPFYQLAYKALVEEHRISSYTLEAFLITGMLLGGYFYTEVITTWFYVLGLKLLRHTESKAKKNLSNLFGTQPRSVWILTNEGLEIEIPFEQLQRDNIVLVSAGQTIAVDGVITTGFASIDQHKLTGESQPVEKGIGDSVLASTIILAGKIGIRIENTGPETVAMQIGHILDETTEFKNSLESRGEVIADKATVPTLGLSILCFPLFGYAAALTVLTNPFGSKIRLFSPASMLAFLNIASQHGILIKDGRSLELLNQVDTLVFDKTGTLTLEQPTVGQIHTYHGVCEDDVLSYAAAAEEGQTHPIAKAILAAANERHLTWPTIVDAKYEMGAGIQVDLSDRVIRIGSDKFMALNDIEVPNEIQDVQAYCHDHGHSLVFVAFDAKIVGVIELYATIRPEAKAVISNLRQRGMSMYIISGDHEAPTKSLAHELGIGHYFANTLPENKANLVTQLQEEGKSVCFVGDGINDSIALKTANISVSLRGATTIATDTAQIILMDGSLNSLEKMFNIAREFDRNMKSNFYISTVPTAICIGGIIIFHWGIVLGLMLAISSLFIGLLNAIRPLLKDQYTKNRIIDYTSD